MISASFVLSLVRMQVFGGCLDVIRKVKIEFAHKYSDQAFLLFFFHCQQQLMNLKETSLMKLQIYLISEFVGLQSISFVAVAFVSF